MKDAKELPLGTKVRPVKGYFETTATIVRYFVRNGDLAADVRDAKGNLFWCYAEDLRKY